MDARTEMMLCRRQKCAFVLPWAWAWKLLKFTDGRELKMPTAITSEVEDNMKFLLVVYVCSGIGRHATSRFQLLKA
jgi:hypothetical protein